MIGCGYKPTKYYAKDKIKGDIYLESKVDINNIDNSILIKDSIIELLLKEFDIKIVENRADADMVVSVDLLSVSHTAMKTSSQDGYTSFYRTTATLSFKYSNKNLTVTDYYDYSVGSDSTITDKKRLEALRLATSKALQNIFSKIAIESFRKN